MKRLRSALRFKNWKLKNKLLVSFILVLLVPSLAIGISSFQKAKTDLSNEILNTAAEDVRLASQEITDTFEPKIDNINYLSDIVNRSMVRDEHQLKLQFNQYIELNPDVSAVYIGTTSGEMIVEPKLNLPSDYDPRDRVWYTDAMSNKGNVIITEPYVDASSQELMITVAKTTSDGTGVLGIDISISKISEYVKDFVLGESGYIIVLDEQNKYLVHPNEETGTEPTEDWAQTVAATASGQFSYTLDGEEKEMIFSTNETTGWKILGTVYTSEIDEASSGILVTTLIVVVASLLVSSVIVTFVIRSIIKPITALTSSVKKISDGDLTEEIHVISNDEVGQLTKDIIEMQSNLKNIIKNVSNASEHVTGQSEELTQAADEVREGSRQIATTMQELASGSESQANNSSELASVMDSFSSKMQEANANGQDIFKSSNDVLELTTEGSKIMKLSVDQMEIIDKIVQESVSKVKGLDSQTKEISKLVSVINDVADQTNLLALNAAIEAARAGEHGKGFAVVADEVRKLAEQVAESVKDISSIVGSIQSESTGVVDSLQGGYKEVEIGTTHIKNTGETFEAIYEAVKEMVANIQTVTDNLSVMSAHSQEMGATIQEIASVAEESAAGVEQTAASAQQASSSMEEVANNSNGLANLAEELNSVVQRFKI
ncbi:methyl-accepting chemotaxis protein [Bacillaceae bacterium S4-13-58]